MKKQELPIIGKVYNYFEDGKINISRHFEVKITDIIPYRDADVDTLEMWDDEREYCDWLYANETDFFIFAIIHDSDEMVFVRTIDGGWFSMGIHSGRLDIDGSLNETIEQN